MLVFIQAKLIQATGNSVSIKHNNISVRMRPLLVNQFMPSVKMIAATKKTSLIMMILLKPLQKSIRKMELYPMLNKVRLINLNTLVNISVFGLLGNKMSLFIEHSVDSFYFFTRIMSRKGLLHTTWRRQSRLCLL